MEKLTDEALVVMYRAGNEKAMDILLDKYKGIVKHKAMAMYIVGGDNDDLIQEGMIGLYKAVRDYESDKNATFSTFASMCINRQMCTAVEKANRKKHQPLNGSISFEAMLGNSSEDDNVTVGDTVQGSNIDNPEEMVIDKERYNELVKKISARLSRYEQQILKLHMRGLGYTEIASKLHKSPKSVDNALQRIKTKISAIVKLDIDK